MIRARIQRADLVLLQVADRQNHNGQVPAGADLAASLQASHARHRQVQQHQIVPAPAQHFQSLFAAARVAYRVALRGQHFAHHSPDLQVVVHYQDLGSGHTLASSCAKGRLNEKTAPSPGWLSTHTRPS